MQDFLTFQLYAPLQSFGAVAVGEIRPSRLMPTRSALIGLLAAALGVRRADESVLQQLHEAYSVACSLHTTSSVMVDYHTVQTPMQRNGRRFSCRKDELGQKLEPGEKLNTILSQREYLENAYYTISVCEKTVGSSPYTLQQLHDSLRAPAFVLYLGRKSCPPSLPLAPSIGQYDSAQSALEAYPLDSVVCDAIGAGHDAVFLSDSCFESSVKLVVRDVPNYEGRPWVEGGRRQFNDRFEYQGVVPVNAKRRKIPAGVGHVYK